MATGGRRLSESRCPHCGALVSETADWCTQCFQSLRKDAGQPQAAPAEPEPEPVTTETLVGGRKDPEGDGAEGPKKEPLWACPACQSENDLDMTLCPVCGTPFARLFDDPAENPRIAPDKAALYGLLPGYGHLRCGKSGDAVARMVFAAGCVALILMFALFSEAGVLSMAITGFFSFLLLFSIGESSMDARRVAAGERELMTARLLLWVFVGAFGLAVVLVTFLSIGRAPEVGGG